MSCYIILSSKKELSSLSSLYLLAYPIHGILPAMLYIAQVLLSAAVLVHIYVFRFLQPTHLHFFLLMYLYVGEVKQYFPGVDL